MIEGKFAIASVYDKYGIVEFCRELNSLGYKIISTSGTYKLLRENKIDVVEVSSITNFPEIFDGRVKTLHPKIHGGILYRERNNHKRQVNEMGIPNIEIVVVNLYPFEETVEKSSNLDEIIENIDIGGPTLLRAAAKNFERVTVVTDKNDYSIVIEKLKNNENTIEFRMMLASKAFNHVAYYDAIISKFFNKYLSEKFPLENSIGVKRVFELRYGENPHQRASAYLFGNEKSASILTSKVLGGKELSYNNILDSDVALEMIKRFNGENFCCIIKHNNPCGAALGKDLKSAFIRAFNSDPISAFGGIVGFSGRVTKDVAEELVKYFFEVIVALSYEEEAVEILRTKKNLRIIEVCNIISCSEDVEIRSINGGILVQEKDTSEENLENASVVTSLKPTDDEMEDLKFAWEIVKFVKSNAIVLVKNKQTIGICGGQTSRVDSVKIAINRARERGFDTNGAVAASDAFFPFKDSVEILGEAGIKAIVQPGGSIRDEDSITEANNRNISMIFTGVRHFKH